MQLASHVAMMFDFDRLVDLLEETHALLRRESVRAVDRSLVIRNWLFGRHIVEYEQHGKDRARYGASLIPNIARVLMRRGMKGASETNLKLFREFYLIYRDKLQMVSAIFKKSKTLIRQTPSDELDKRFPLSWSHYVFLVHVPDAHERQFYEVEAMNEGWSLSELKRQFNSSLYERLCLSRNRNQVRTLTRKGHLIEEPADAIKDPYVLEFLGLEERNAYSESDLEQAIIDKLERFLLELGKGFLFEARQRRLTFSDEHFYVDLVFYNRLLRCYVLVDLKMGRITHQDLGQMQMYVNYFDRHIRTADENPTIGILLCRTKKDAVVELTLPRGNKTIFASRYQLYLPSKEELKKQLMSPEKAGRRQRARPSNA